MSDIKQKYPSADTTALTITLASLASDTNMLAGRESNAVNNSSTVDLDHLLSGFIKLGTSPTTARAIEVWVYAPISIASGTPTYPDVMDGSDSNETCTSLNSKTSMMRLAWTTQTDATTGQTYYMPPTSIAGLFGDMPQYWGIFVVHGTGVNLDSTGSNHGFHYQRIQKQTV